MFSTSVTVLIVIAICIIIFIICRELICWYFKINEGIFVIKAIYNDFYNDYCKNMIEVKKREIWVAEKMSNLIKEEMSFSDAKNFAEMEYIINNKTNIEKIIEKDKNEEEQQKRKEQRKSFWGGINDE